jgi:serine/threonine-protein kinase
VTQTTSAEVPIGRSRGSGQRVAGALVGVAGLVGLGVGTYFGVTSLQDHNDAQPHCSNAGCDATGVSLRNDARQTGTISTIALIGGGAAALLGIVVYATAPHSSATTSVAVGPGGVTAWGTF